MEVRASFVGPILQAKLGHSYSYAPPRSKWMYFVARYFGLLTQLYVLPVSQKCTDRCQNSADEAIVVVQAEMVHGRGFCKVWVCFEIFVLRIFVSVSEAVMMMRGKLPI